MHTVPPTLFGLYVAHMQDLIAEADGVDTALRHIDTLRRVVAGRGVFSIQQNVTTARHPKNEVWLQRFYSSEVRAWPVKGSKRKPLNHWAEMLFVRGQIFVGEGPRTLERWFDDHVQMQSIGLKSVINVPLMQGPLCYATFNVFGTCDGWQPHQVEAVRLLAMAASRWVPPAADLAYTFESTERAVP